MKPAINFLDQAEHATKAYELALADMPRRFILVQEYVKKHKLKPVSLNQIHDSINVGISEEDIDHQGSILYLLEHGKEKE